MKNDETDTHLAYQKLLLRRYNLLNVWLEKRNEGKKISKYLKENKIYDVAIYALGSVGERLAEELLNDGINITYIIDQRYILQGGRYNNIPVVSMKYMNKYRKTAMIIVSLLKDFEEIKKELRKENQLIKIVSVEEIINSL